MNKLNTGLLAVSLFVAPALTLVAQQPEGPPAKGRVLFGQSPLFAVLDLDRNGVISTAEIARAPTSLAALDRNRDGQITPDELGPPQAMLGPGAQGTRRLRKSSDEVTGSNQTTVERRLTPSAGTIVKIVSPLFKVLDVDGDGVLSADEIANSWKTLLDLDANLDGSLTADEVGPPRAE